MWGNRLGWGISVLIIGLTIWAISLVKASGEPSAPTAQFKADPSALTPLTLPAAPQSVVPMDDACDAADYYLKVIETYKAAVKPDRFIIEAPLFDDFPKPEKKFTKLSAVPPDVLAKIKAVAEEDLIPATHCKTCNLFIKRPGDVINYLNWEDREALIALERTGNAVLHLALLMLRSGDAHNADQAWKYFDAVFALGAKLEQERIVYQEYYIGVSLMSGAARMIANESPNPGQQGAAQAFITTYNKYVAPKGPVESKWHVVSSIDPGNVAEHSGDVFYLARNSADRMWRVEAILKLGRIRYIEGASRGDQTGAIREIKKLANDPDPLIRAAGIAARDLTRDENFKGH